MQYRQENYLKYDGRNIGSETTSTTPAGPWSGCAKTPIVPMTYKRSNIETGINAMSAAGNTLIAEGLAWGMRVQSPSQPFTKVEGTASIAADTISTYNHPRWMKTVVLMTDGDNDWCWNGYPQRNSVFLLWPRQGNARHQPVWNNLRLNHHDEP